MKETMKAVLRTKYGSPDVLTIGEVAKPKPKANEVLIRVHATTVNRTDCAILSAKPFVMRFFTGLLSPSQATPGTDFAGTIEELGSAVTQFTVGTRVWGFNDTGLASQAEYMTLAEDEAINPIPDHIPYEQAAASAEGAHYAYNVLNRVNLQSGQKVLVNGATGAIGSAAIQFLKYNNIAVTAVCHTHSLDLIKSLGVERVIDYAREDFTRDHEKYDFVFDAVGKSTFFKCKRLLNKEGTYISTELGPYAQNPFLALLTPVTGGKRVKFPIPLNIKASLKFTQHVIQKGEFTPLIDKKHPIEQIAEAYHYVASGRKIGNVIIVMNDYK